MMAHLIADQAVPAHAGNVKHGFQPTELDPGDNFEGQSFNESPLQGGTIIKNDPDIVNLLKRYYYYKNDFTGEIDGSIPETQFRLPFWKKLSEWSQPAYWKENDNANTDDAYKYKGQAFYDTWGYYGGPNGTDIYDEENDTQGIISRQFLQSVAYMAGFFRIVSEKLPPVESNLELWDQVVPGSIDSTITSTKGIKIRFVVDENRKENVKVKITVDGKAIKDTSGFIWDGSEVTSSQLTYNPDTNQLPYKGILLKSWNGLLEDETYPTDGKHNLVVQVQDDDGNWSDALEVPFRIDMKPPQATNIQPSENTFFRTNQITFSAILVETGSNVDDSNTLQITLDDNIYNKNNGLSYDKSTGRLSLNISLSEGVHNWKIEGKDINGNQIVDTMHKFTIDSKPLMISVE